MKGPHRASSCYAAHSRPVDDALGRENQSMSLLNIGVGLSAHVRLPRVVRYLQDEHVDSFLQDGTLWLTSFRKCANHDDNRRHDAREGRLTMSATAPGGSTLNVVALPAPNLYVMCGSVLADRTLRDDFGGSGFVISKPFEFAAEIARAIPNCTGLAQGPCFYEPESVQRHELSEPIISRDPESEEELVGKMDAAIASIDQLSSVFTKPAVPFAEQHEYRFIWYMEHDVEEHLEIRSPAAAKYCTRLELPT